eukprot:scaffold102750_cov75-Phaeocystis_antarctica.AAC.3
MVVYFYLKIENTEQAGQPGERMVTDKALRRLSPSARHSAQGRAAGGVVPRHSAQGRCWRRHGGQARMRQ